MYIYIYIQRESEREREREREREGDRGYMSNWKGIYVELAWSAFEPFAARFAPSAFSAFSTFTGGMVLHKCLPKPSRGHTPREQGCAVGTRGTLCCEPSSGHTAPIEPFKGIPKEPQRRSESKTGPKRDSTDAKNAKNRS